MNSKTTRISKKGKTYVYDRYDSVACSCCGIRTTQSTTGKCKECRKIKCIRCSKIFLPRIFSLRGSYCSNCFQTIEKRKGFTEYSSSLKDILEEFDK